jgi:Tfp pilus assembly protein FimT
VHLGLGKSSPPGFSLVELLVVMGLTMILIGIAVTNLKQLDNPLQNGAAQLLGFIKQVRAKAISSTSAYVIQPFSSTRLITRHGTTCSDPNMTADSRAVLDLPSGAHLTSTNWNLCFSTRGFPDANIEIQLQDVGGSNKTVELMLGGAVRIQ